VPVELLPLDDLGARELIARGRALDEWFEERGLARGDPVHGAARGQLIAAGFAAEGIVQRHPLELFAREWTADGWADPINE